VGGRLAAAAAAAAWDVQAEGRGCSITCPVS